MIFLNVKLILIMNFPIFFFIELKIHRYLDLGERRHLAYDLAVIAAALPTLRVDWLNPPHFKIFHKDLNKYSPTKLFLTRLFKMSGDRVFGFTSL